MGSEDMCKLVKEYLNAMACRFYTFSRQNLDNFDISYCFLPLTVAKLSTIKSSFWLTVYIKPIVFITMQLQAFLYKVKAKYLVWFVLGNLESNGAVDNTNSELFSADDGIL